MKDLTHDMDFDEFDEAMSPRPEESDFDQVVERALSRRGFIGGALAFGSVAAIGAGAAPQAQAAAHAKSSRFAFEQIPTSTADDIMLPPGYSYDVVVRWGDPISPDGPEFDHATLGTGASQAVTFGDNIDGMELFQIGDSTVVVVNNEYTNRKVLWKDGVPGGDDDILKGKMAHGLSIVEVDDASGKWEVVKDSPYNRRVTPDTPMEITGPARGHDLLKTAAEPTGTMSLGTWNNCGSGTTPWGTYLACEENFNGYFSASDEGASLTDGHKRYGVRDKDWGYGWAQIDERYDVAKHPNEPNRAGWVVEVDPSDPTSTPKKRTALGRFKHENAEVVINADGRVVIYMGDDERGEYLYRYISDGVYAPGADTDDLMENGTLYVARFDDDGTGTWLALTPETTGMASKAEVMIHARMGASAVGGTTMDRPEWVTANPNAAEVYVALTNNKNRGVKPNAGGDDTSVNGPNPREANKYGQIARWRPDGGDHTADGFAWDLFVLAGNPTVHSDANAGSDNVNAGNMFNSPDGLAFDSAGMIWIQTDGSDSNEGDFAGQGNNMMLCGDPATGEIRRFMVGPRDCEVTGLMWSPDRKTMFVGIQHPGDSGNSHWPEGGDATPRSAVIAVKRDDGGFVG
ncbi:MAG: PhoX family phosphatase [Pseudomonadota bacterium]